MRTMRHANDSQKMINKYRPRNLNEIVGQKKQIQIISGAVKMNKLNGPYLFSGPSGVGKSATALCFARAILCQNYNFANMATCEKCKPCSYSKNNPDILHYNCGMIDTSRDGLKSFSSGFAFCPTHRARIYILDELHCWKRDVQERFATTIEQIPAHTLVIFTSSESDRVYDFFRERCTEIIFNEPNHKSVLKRLNAINTSEGNTIVKKDLEAISKRYDGQVRGAINCLERLILARQVNSEILAKSCFT